MSDVPKIVRYDLVLHVKLSNLLRFILDATLCLLESCNFYYLVPQVQLYKWRVPSVPRVGRETEIMNTSSERMESSVRNWGGCRHSRHAKNRWLLRLFEILIYNGIHTLGGSRSAKDNLHQQVSMLIRPWGCNRLRAGGSVCLVGLERSNVSLFDIFSDTKIRLLILFVNLMYLW